MHHLLKFHEQKFKRFQYEIHIHVFSAQTKANEKKMSKKKKRAKKKETRNWNDENYETVV